MINTYVVAQQAAHLLQLLNFLLCQILIITTIVFVFVMTSSEKYFGNYKKKIQQFSLIFVPTLLKMYLITVRITGTLNTKRFTCNFCFNNTCARNIPYFLPKIRSCFLETRSNLTPCRNTYLHNFHAH